jgi:DNA-binding response OmpR family regulator
MSGEEALQSIHTSLPDLIILDVELKGDLDGFQVLERVRSKFPWQEYPVPVIMLTVRRSIDEKVWSLTTGGANDYLTKPYDAQELKARVIALMRGIDHTLPGARCLIATIVDPSTNYKHTICLRQDGRQGPYQVWLDTQEIDLDRGTARLLRYFMEHPNEYHSMKRLIDNVIGWERGTDEAVRARVRRLRKALKDREVEFLDEKGQTNKAFIYIQSERGTGYTFSGSVQPCNPH